MKHIVLAILCALAVAATVYAGHKRFDCDVNNDGRVSILDLVIVRDAILNCDVNHDGKVDQRDLKAIEWAILNPETP